MLIVAGWFEVDPGDRDAFIASQVDGMTASRGEPGCVEYVFSPDPLVPGRVVLYEFWQDKPPLAAHLARCDPAPAHDAGHPIRAAAVRDRVGRPARQLSDPLPGVLRGRGHAAEVGTGISVAGVGRFEPHPARTPELQPEIPVAPRAPEPHAGSSGTRRAAASPPSGP